VTSPDAPLKLRSVATRGSGTLPSMAAAIARTPGPEIRTTPMPARPAAVAIAAIVSASWLTPALCTW
jgi:hypothetical protein